MNPFGKRWIFHFSQLDGEWFIDDGGFAQFADGDIGDLNHEAAALQSMIPEELWEKYDSGTLSPEERAEIGEEFLQYMESGGEAREWMVEKNNWIRVHGYNFELNVLDSDAIKRLADFVGEQLREYDDEVPEDEEIYVEELSTGNTISIPVVDLYAADDSPGDALATLKMRLGLDQTNLRTSPQNIQRKQIIDEQLMMAPQARGVIGYDNFIKLLQQTQNLSEYQLLSVYKFIVRDAAYISSILKEPETYSNFINSIIVGVLNDPDPTTTKTAALSPTNQISKHIQSALLNYLDGNWKVLKASDELAPGFSAQRCGYVEMEGRNVKSEGDVYYVKIFYKIRKRLEEIPYHLYEGTKEETDAAFPYKELHEYDPATGHKLVAFRGFVEGWKGPNGPSHEQEERLFPIHPSDVRSKMLRIGEFGDWYSYEGEELPPPVDTPYEVAVNVKQSIDQFWSFGGDGDTPEETGPNSPAPVVSSPGPLVLAETNWFQKVSSYQWGDEKPRSPYDDWRDHVEVALRDNPNPYVGDFHFEKSNVYGLQMGTSWQTKVIIVDASKTTRDFGRIMRLFVKVEGPFNFKGTRMVELPIKGNIHEALIGMAKDVRKAVDDIIEEEVKFCNTMGVDSGWRKITASKKEATGPIFDQLIKWKEAVYYAFMVTPHPLFGTFSPTTLDKKKWISLQEHSKNVFIIVEKAGRSFNNVFLEIKVYWKQRRGLDNVGSSEVQILDYGDLMPTANRVVEEAFKIIEREFRFLEEMNLREEQNG